MALAMEKPKVRTKTKQKMGWQVPATSAMPVASTHPKISPKSGARIQRQLSGVKTRFHAVLDELKDR